MKVLFRDTSNNEQATFDRWEGPLPRIGELVDFVFDGIKLGGRVFDISYAMLERDGKEVTPINARILLK